jgi:hypothetical protein
VADKPYLAVANNHDGGPRFFVTWSLFSASPEVPIMLSDSIDGLHWRTTRISGPSACDVSSQPVPVGSTVYVAWAHQDDCTANLTAGSEVVAAVDARTAQVISRITVAPVHGTGDTAQNCATLGIPSTWEVIETQPGHDARVVDIPSMTADENGVLYLTWNDRPGGIGGPPSNATRVYLSYSTDGGTTWSTPQVISGPLSSTTMSDRFQPAITADQTGLHAAWYERVPGVPVDLIRTDREDMTLARDGHRPIGFGEKPLSTVSFPIIQTNPQQDPSPAADCYMGDYNGVTSTHGTVYATWGDNRNVVTTTNGPENQPDVFLQSWRP